MGVGPMAARCLGLGQQDPDNFQCISDVRQARFGSAMRQIVRLGAHVGIVGRLQGVRASRLRHLGLQREGQYANVRCGRLAATLDGINAILKPAYSETNIDAT